MRAMGFSVAIVLFFFNGWNWYTSIFGGKTAQDYVDDDVEEFSIVQVDSWKENIFIIFGTFSLVRALLVPVKRILPLTGLEFTFAALENKDFSFKLVGSRTSQV